MSLKFNLDSFKRASETMIATNEQAYSKNNYGKASRLKNYTKEEIKGIIDSGDLISQIKLSRNYFDKDNLYRRIILHYATILKFAGVLIPNPMLGKSLSNSAISKRYYNAIDFVERLKLQEIFTEITRKALVDGTYYGLLLDLSRDGMSVADLPAYYCRSRFKDAQNNAIIEFDVTYFNTIVDQVSKQEALSSYPKVITKHYEKYVNGKTSCKWVIIPSDIGICFRLFEGKPLFLSVIPASIDYEAAIENEREREREEIRKILVQQVPHLNDGGLLFEPDEAAEMHSATVGMMKNNKNISVLTTYNDVEAIASKTTSDNVNNNLEKMLQNVYSQAGISGEIFATDGSSSLEISLQNDTALMMMFAHKYSEFVSNIVNRIYANGNVTFKYEFLAVTYYNDQDFADETFKLAQSGYSFLLPAVAMGLSQRDIVNIKGLENDILDLEKQFVPLNNSYNQANSTESSEEGGRPELDKTKKSEKTNKNEKSLEKNN